MPKIKWGRAASRKPEKVFEISADGDSITSIHSDTLPDFGDLVGAPRASEVEFIAGIGWTIKLTDHERNGIYRDKYVKNYLEISDAPIGFVTRALALGTEVAFINNMILGK